MRITPENITSLKEDEVFVFGSNLRGMHGAGAAKQALQWGAVIGRGIGMGGSTYAIPTKGRLLQTLSIKTITPYVAAFLAYTKKFPEKKFLVTAIGCGLAGYTPDDIAPLFRYAIELKNVYLPESFWRVLNPHSFIT